jgi:excisionase family DNA binding protein
MAEEWLTTEQAAELSGYHENYIRRIIRAGKVRAQKFGPTWQVNRDSLLQYLDMAKKTTDKRWGPKD